MLFLASTRNHAVRPPNNIKLRPHSILYYTILFCIFCLICFCLCCPLAYDEQSHEHVCHVTHQTVGDIHFHTFKHGMDVSHDSIADMNLFFLHIKLQDITNCSEVYLCYFVPDVMPMMIVYASCHPSKHARHPCPCFSNIGLDVSHASMVAMINACHVFHQNFKLIHGPSLSLDLVSLMFPWNPFSSYI
jgi:hypothetical protein